MDLRSRIRLWSVVVVYSLCYSNGILNSVGNAHVTDYISDELADINSDNQYDATTFASSGKSAGDNALDGESDENTGIVRSGIHSISNDDPTDISTEEPTTDKTNFLIGDHYPISDDGTIAISVGFLTISQQTTDMSYTGSTDSIQLDDIEISSLYPTTALFNKGTETSNSKPVNDSFVLSFESYLPEIEDLCPGISVCGRTGDNDVVVAATATNHCCINCSCEPSCIKYQTCCFDNVVNDGRQEIVSCIMPIVGDYDISLNVFEVPSYRFVVAPPMNGCKSADAITIEKINNAAEKVSPWGDLYPVYSKSLDLNFKNERIAICHGARDINHWKVKAVYGDTNPDYGIKIMTNFLRTFNSSDVLILFEPPLSEIIHIDYMCFRAIGDTCPIERINAFKIPPYIQTDRKEIVAACENGPRALYLAHQTFAYKNIYCALCNDFILPPKDFGNDHCGYIGYMGRLFLGSFAVLLGSDFIEAVNTQSTALRDTTSDLGCYRPENLTNNVDCEHLQCPMFQIKLADSQCGYPSILLLIEHIHVRLNVSTTQLLDKTFIENLTEADLQSSFQRLSPWRGCWKIELIGLRIKTNANEFIIQLDCKAGHFELNNVNKGLRKLLSKKWVVHFNNRTIRFNQQLDIHGDTHTVGYQPPLRNTNFIPYWTQLAADTNRSSAIYEKVVWKQLYQRNSFSPSSLQISKLFFCYQIELKNNDYEIQYNSIVYVKQISKHLYPNEYSLFQDEFGSQKVRVCLEDSSYITSGSVTMKIYLHFLFIVVLCHDLMVT